MYFGMHRACLYRRTYVALFTHSFNCFGLGIVLGIEGTAENKTNILSKVKEETE